MPTLSDFTKLHNSSTKMVSAANDLALNIRKTVDDVRLIENFLKLGKAIIAADEALKAYALYKTDELGQKSKSLN